MRILKQSTGYTLMFLMIDSADHFSPKTGLAPTVTISKAGAAFAGAGGTVTEVANGFYKIVLTTTDTNTLGDLAFHCTAAAADNTDFAVQISVRNLDDLAFPATSGRSMVVDASGLVDANAVKLGPSGSGTAQTARDIGASVLLAAASIQAIWDALTSALTTTGSIGKFLVGLVNSIWDEPLSGHSTVGTAGKTLSSAGSSGDPWSTALPGVYAAGTAGYILGRNLDKQVSLINFSGVIGTIGFPKDDPTFKKLQSYMDDSMDVLKQIVANHKNLESSIACGVYENEKSLGEIRSLKEKYSEYESSMARLLESIIDLKNNESTREKFIESFREEVFSQIQAVTEIVSSPVEKPEELKHLEDFKDMLEAIHLIIVKMAPTEVLEQIEKPEENDDEKNNVGA